MNPSFAFSRKTKSVVIVLVVLVIKILIVDSLRLLWSNNGGASNFWFDESNQFLTSQGVNFWESSTGVRGSLMDALTLNRSLNLDPGGFTVLLRIWVSLFGGSPISLRLCAFISICLLTFGSLLLLWLITRSIAITFFLALFIPFILFNNDDVLHHSFELRAYGYSLAFSVLLPLFAVALLKFNNIYSIYILVILSCLASSFRYDNFIYSSSVLFSILFVFWTDRRQLRSGLIAPMLLYLTFTTFVYFGMTKFQNSGRSPSYVDSFSINSLDWRIMRQHLLHNFQSWPYFLRIPSICIGLFVIKKSKFQKFQFSDQIKLLTVFQLLTLGMQLLFSLSGLMPWWVGERWSLNDIGYSLIALTTILLSCFGFATSLFGAKRFLPIKFAHKALVVTLASLLFSSVIVFTSIISKTSLQIIKPNYAFSRNGPNLVEVNRNFFSSSQIPLVITYGLFADLKYILDFSELYPELKYLNGPNRRIWTPGESYQFPFIAAGQNVCDRRYRMIMGDLGSFPRVDERLSKFSEFGIVTDIQRFVLSPQGDVIFFYFTPFANCLVNG